MKTLVSILLVLTLIFAFASCGNPNSGSTDNTPPVTDDNGGDNSGTTDTEPDTDDKTVLQRLSEMTAKNYTSVKLSVETNTDGILLNASYIMSHNSILYSVERLNMLPTDGNLSGVSKDYMTVYKGTAVVENGQITSIDGDTVTLPEYTELVGRFDFSSDNFSDTVEEEGKFTAKVTDAKSFLGIDKEVTDMTVTVEYTDVITKITLTYTLGDTAVKSVYEFTA